MFVARREVLAEETANTQAAASAAVCKATAAEAIAPKATAVEPAAAAAAEAATGVQMVDLLVLLQGAASTSESAPSAFPEERAALALLAARMNCLEAGNAALVHALAATLALVRQQAAKVQELEATSTAEATAAAVTQPPGQLQL